MHPNCPSGGGIPWAAVVASPESRIKSAATRANILATLAPLGPLGGGPPIVVPPALLTSEPFKRVLELCPCLYAQIAAPVSARGVVHLCEVTMGVPIVSTNVYQAFQIQHPAAGTPPFLYPPAIAATAGGDIMEALCSEVLTNHGMPHMEVGPDGWPIWAAKSHLSLNSGAMRPLKLYGDLLIPAAPHNLLISVKSEAARERFVVSGNRLESVGFGFFNDPSEFWTVSRMNLMKRWGFSAIYMPTPTLDAINSKLASRGHVSHSFNINGQPLFRPLDNFGPDMLRVAGRLTIDF